MVITAIGIGSNINEDTLHQIAGKAGHVITVADFNKLVEKMDQIKETICCK